MKLETYFPREGNKNVRLSCYILDESPEMPGLTRDAMLVLPGGAYAMCSDREAEPVAMQYLAEGMNCFVLRYSVGEEAVFPAPLADASLAMKFIRENSERFAVNPDRVFAVGFSAGGHLCASLGTFWDARFLHDAVDIERGINKPTGTILAYPVITSGKMGHKDSFYNILGTRTPTAEQLEAYSVEKHISPDTAPAFIWTTADDTCVPSSNSLLMAMALAENNIPYELHVFPHGPHGLSVAKAQTAVNQPALENRDIASWVRMTVRWMKTIR